MRKVVLTFLFILLIFIVPTKVSAEIAVKDKNDNVMPIFPGSNWKNNTYEIIESDNNTQIKVFSKSDNEKKILILNYTIQDAANRYKEFGELYWNFYKVESSKSIKDVNLDLSLKNSKFDLNKFKYWVYVDGGDFKY